MGVAEPGAAATCRHLLMPQVPASRSFLVSGQRNRGFSPQGFYGPMNLNRCAGDATTYDSAVTQPASAGLGHCCAAPPGCWTPSGGLSWCWSSAATQPASAATLHSCAAAGSDRRLELVQVPRAEPAGLSGARPAAARRLVTTASRSAASSRSAGLWQHTRPRPTSRPGSTSTSTTGVGVCLHDEAQHPMRDGGSRQAASS